MVIMSNIQQKDVEIFVRNFNQSELLANTRILITGATGLVGSTLVRCLLALNKGIEIFCPVRNISKAYSMFSEDCPNLHFVDSGLIEYLNGISEQDAFQYVVHCASPTSGKYMIEHPVQTYLFAIDSTRAILEYGRKNDVKGIVYVSSLEYYGQNLDDIIITEDMIGYIDNTDARSSYPLGKRAAEYLCAAYSKEYGVNVKIARLTQTFGAGVAADDNRVFAQFARSILSNTDIVLHTKGDSAKPYCYTTDCVSAILYILLKGNRGEAYNVANEETYISIREMAEFLCDNYNPNIKVVVEEHPEMGYAPVMKLHLSTKKLESLGWKPQYDLKEMFDRLIDSIADVISKKNEL